MVEPVDPRTSFTRVHGAFEPDLLRRLRSRLEEVWDTRQRCAMSDRERQAIARGESSDALRTDSHWFDPWRSPSPDLRQTIGSHTWVVFPPQVRFVRAMTHHVPWHQDAGYQRLLGRRGHQRHVTCFVPLDEDPARRTTIQFVRGSLPELEHQPLDGFGAGLDREVTAQLEHYELELGDALVFGDLTLHRTYLPPGGLIERRSLEFRLVRPEHAVSDKDYFDIVTCRFVRRDGEARVAS